MMKCCSIAGGYRIEIWLRVVVFVQLLSGNLVPKHSMGTWRLLSFKLAALTSSGAYKVGARQPF